MFSDWNRLDVYSIENLKSLPNQSGLYAICKGDEILYIGKSMKIRYRWWSSGLRILPKTNHEQHFMDRLQIGCMYFPHKHLELVLEGGCYIRYKLLPKDEITIAEHLLIREIKPKLNIVKH